MTIDELRAKAFSIVLAQNGVITVHKRQIPTPIGSTQEVLVKLADAEAALAECEREKAELKRANEELEPVWCKSKDVVADLKRKLAECEREKGRLQDIIVKGRKAIEDAHDLLAETPRPDDRMSASTRDNHMIAWECICEALAALTEAGEGEK